MTDQWLLQETNTHQDHVIAHVIGATILGFFETESALHILLDIGFVWTIYIDGEMGLVPQSVAISELSIGGDEKDAIETDVRFLHESERGAPEEERALTRIIAPPVDCLIEEVDFYTSGARRRLLIRGEEASLVVETSLDTGEILIKSIGDE